MKTQKSYKSYKFRFYPTPAQEQQLAKEFGCARFVWNHCLDMCSKAYERRNERFNYVSLGKHITQLKKTTRFHWLKESTACVLTQKMIDMDASFKNFFKHGAKYPRFKKKLHAQSIRFTLDKKQIHRTYVPGKRLQLPKVGVIDIRWSQIPQGIPKMATVSKTASGKYFVSFMCEVDIVHLEKTQKSVGIDIGIRDVVVTSDGFYSGAPRLTYQYERKLKHAQRDLGRKTKGSNRWHAQRIVVAKIHERIVHSRKDFLHKLTTRIVREYDVISLEDLYVKGMIQNRALSKAVADVGMFELKRQLIYKAAWYGKQVILIDRWFPSTKTCSNCEKRHDMTLKQRIMVCECGLQMCRDRNAAKNILRAGIVQRGASNQPCVA